MATRFGAVLAPATSVTRLPVTRALLTRGRLRQILGGIWLLDGLLQLQPSMFTSSLVTGIMQPTTQGQPALVADTLQPVLSVTAHHVVLVNLAIMAVQVTLGLCLLTGKLVRPALLASVAWSFAVWYGGEGMGMLLTGNASVLTGAPGAVLLYGLLALVAYPVDNGEAAIVSRRDLRLILAGFWGMAAVLQLQPSWWQPGQISAAIANNEGSGLQARLIGGSLRWASQITAGHESLVNVLFIAAALGIAVSLVTVRRERVRIVLVASIVLSALLWWATEGFGGLLGGSATDPNSGPLVALMSLASWPVLTSRTRPAAQPGAQVAEEAAVEPILA